MIYFKDLLNELIKVNNIEAIRDAKKNNTEILLYWNNGIVGTDPNEIHSMGFNGIGCIVNFKDKLVRFFLMDDWSDFKFILRIQKFIKDVMKAGFIEKNWKINITGEKSTKINLGGSTIADLLKYDASFTKNIPISFHGTSDYYLDDIKRFGIRPPKDRPIIKNWDTGYIDDSSDQIYLSIDYDRAHSYAEQTVSKLKENEITSKPIVIELENIPLAFVDADDDFIESAGMLQLLSFLKTGKAKIPNDYVASIRSSSQFAYKGRIQKKYIRKIYK